MEGDNIIMNMYEVRWMKIEQGANQSMIRVTTRCRWMKSVMKALMVMKVM